MRIFIIGYPGTMGGANTECLHTVKLWRRAGWQVDLVPTWGDPKPGDPVRDELDALGCTTHGGYSPERLEDVPGLAGAICVGMCNSRFIEVFPRLRAMGCKLIWVNCMTFLFDHERQCFTKHGPADAYVFQSRFQHEELAPALSEFGYTPQQGALIRGAFDFTGWRFSPRPRKPGEPFVVGRVSRPDQDKWSSNTWAIYKRIQYEGKRALMLGMNESTHNKCGPAPAWAECLRPQAISAAEYFGRIHCLLPVNGGARENWPRAGLEAMAAGVPIVAQNAWGWREMIEHGVTGFLGATDTELAHWAAVLAHDEERRLQTAHAAYKRLVEDLANPQRIAEAWGELFGSLREPAHA